jgi:LuxR family maltose regulon positive regulatory protein
MGDEPVSGLSYGCGVRRVNDGRMVPRTAAAEQIAAVAGAGGVVVVAAEAGTGKRVLAQQALERLADAEVVVHDADRCDADGLVQLGRTLATRTAGTGAIVVARHDPGLCLIELGATGPVLELDGQDLAWSEAEVAEGLERWGIIGDAEYLATITEGWCAAVRLGAFAGEHALAPASEPLAEYLFADALRGVPPELRDAILRLAFADTFVAGDVASLVGDGADGEQTLAALTRWRLFLRPAGPGPGPDAWRMHRLVAAVARRRLAIEDPAAARLLRARGPVGVADPSATVDATVTDPALARHAWELLLDGRLTRPSPAALELAQSSGAAAARLAAALGLLASGDARLAAPLLVTGERDQRDPAHLLAQLMVARLDGDHVTVDERARTLDGRPDADLGLRAMAAVERGILSHDLGMLVEGDRHLAIGAGLAGHAGRPAVLGRAQGALALSCVASGRLREATRHAEAALAEPAPGLPDGQIRATLALALCTYLRDELASAGEIISRARQLAAETRDDALWGLVLLYDAIVAEALGDYDRARFTLAEARAATRHPVVRVRWPLLDFVHVRLLDHVGRSDEAARLAAALPRTLDTDLAHARGLLTQQRPRDAMALLAPWTAHASTDSPLAGRVSWHLVTFALAAVAAQDDEAAHSALERALDLAAPELLRRPFVEERARLRPLLERHGAGATKHGAFVQELLERRGSLERAAASDAQLREPLTERERVVLGYLPSTMTAAEVAAALTVSEATVRTHLRHIYEKLGATGRRDAVDRARTLGLLAQDLPASRDRWAPDA